MSRMTFELLGSDGAARRGRLSFPRGTVETPAFMPRREQRQGGRPMIASQRARTRASLVCRLAEFVQ